MEKDNAKSIKVVITGPESTGKSTLSEQLATHFNTSYVPEYARAYLKKTQGVYTEKDLLAIARGQIATEDALLAKNPELLIYDTSLEVLRVWSEWKYSSCDPFILGQARSRIPDLFLLMKPDLPWEADPLRENQYDRDNLYDYYLKTLNEYEAKVVEIYGDGPLRTKMAVNAINNMFPDL